MYIVLLIRVLRCMCNPTLWLQLVLINKLQTTNYNDANQSFSSLASLSRAERSNWSVETTTEVSTDSFYDEKFSCLYDVRSNDYKTKGR